MNLFEYWFLTSLNPLYASVNHVKFDYHDKALEVCADYIYSTHFIDFFFSILQQFNRLHYLPLAVHWPSTPTWSHHHYLKKLSRHHHQKGFQHFIIHCCSSSCHHYALHLQLFILQTFLIKMINKRYLNYYLESIR